MTEETGLIKIESSEVQLDVFNVFVAQLKKGSELLKAFEQVKTATELVSATDYLGKAKKLINLVNKEVENLCRPLKDRKREIDDAQRKLKERAEEVCKELSIIVGKVETSILAFNKAERIRVENETKAQQEAIQNAAQEVKDLGPLASEEDIEEATNKASEQFVRPVISAPSIKGLTVTWKYEVIDPLKVPSQYCSPDPTKIQTAVRSGTRDIPGVRIYQDETIRAGR